MTSTSQRPEPIALTIVMGFPGAGKSRFISAAVAAAPELTAGILVDEPRTTTARIAAGTVIGTAGTGCLCCAGATELQATLEDLLRRRDNGRMPPVTQVLVELDGLADPLGPLAALLRHPYLSLRYRPTGMIAVVDPRVPLDAVHALAPAWRQLTLATFHHWTGAAAPAERDRLAAACPAAAPLHPRAALAPLDPAGWDVADRRNWLSSRLGGADRPRPGARRAEHDSFGIEDARLTLPPARSLADLARFLDQFGARFGHSLLRLKGHVALADAPHARVRIEAGRGWIAPLEGVEKGGTTEGLILRAPADDIAEMQHFIAGTYPSSR